MEDKGKAMEVNAEAIVASYAAIVATAALVLEVRRWFESKPRLRVRVNAPRILIGGSATAERKYAIVSVANVGSFPTTIENLGVADYESWWHFLRGRNNGGGVIVNPAMPGQQQIMPKLIAAGEVWTGFIDVTAERDYEWILSGQCYALLYFSHAKKPIRCKIVSSETVGAKPKASQPKQKKDPARPD